MKHKKFIIISGLILVAGIFSAVLIGENQRKEDKIEYLKYRYINTKNEKEKEAVILKIGQIMDSKNFGLNSVLAGRGFGAWLWNCQGLARQYFDAIEQGLWDLAFDIFADAAAQNCPLTWDL